MKRLPDPTFDQRLADWLEDDPSHAPSAVLDTVVAAFPLIEQRRRSGMPWRYAPVHWYSLTAVAAAVLVVVVGTAILVTRPAPNIGPATSPTSTVPALPASRPLTPTAVIDLAGKVTGAIAIVADGDDIWIETDGSLVHVDEQTNATREIAVPHAHASRDIAVSRSLTGNGLVAAGQGELWISVWNGLRIERIDPLTGRTLLEADAPGPIEIFFVGDQLWVGTDLDSSVHLVDRATGVLGPKVGLSDHVSVGLGQFWMGEPGLATARTITRVDPATSTITGTITVPVGAGCDVGGSFPDNVWAGCPTLPDLTRETAMTVARIDPATDTVATVATVPAAYGGVAAVIDGVPWMFILSTDAGGNNVTTLVAIDPATGALTAALDLGRMDPDVAVVTSTAMWIADEQNDRVVRYDLTALRP
jgi:hypothetical protein